MNKRVDLPEPTPLRRNTRLELNIRERLSIRGVRYCNKKPVASLYDTA